MAKIQVPPGYGNLEAAIGQANAGDVLELQPGRHLTHAPIRITRGGASGQPLVIRGTRGAIIDGEKRPNPADLSPPLPPGVARLPRDSDWAFFKLTSVEYVEFDHLEIEGCWPVAIFAQDSRHLALRGSVMRGSTFVFFVRDDTTTSCTHFLIEGNHWTQDTSRDHDLWRRHSWREAHGGEGGNATLRYFDGGLFGSRDLGGNVIFRHNKVFDAFNGVVFWASAEIQLAANYAALVQRNRNLFVYGNEFTRVRDNPIEPEAHAHNLHIRHNLFTNCHAWISLDEVAGGNWYIYGNVGHYTEKQGGPTNTLGKVLKLSEGTAMPSRPVYVFNNSWYLRCPVIPGDAAKPMQTSHLHFFNNAIQYCRAGDPAGAPAICNPDVAFVEQLDWTKPDLEFDFDLSNHPSFLKTMRTQHQEASGRESPLPYFVDAPGGNFLLAGNSPAKGWARAVKVQLHDGSQATVAIPSDVGAYQGGNLISAPDLEKQDSGFFP